MLILLLIFIALHLIPIFIDGQYFWGVDAFSFANPLISIIVLIIILLSFTNTFKQKFEKILDSLFNVNRNLRYIIILVLSFLSFYILSTSTHFLGDGYLRIRNLEGGIFFSTQEPLDTFIHQFIYHLLKDFFGLTAEGTYISTSIISGIISVFFILKFIDYLKVDSLKKGIIFLIFISLATNQLFFGYIESYSIFTMLLIIYFYYSYKFIVEGRNLIVISIMFSLLLLTHSLGLLLLPSFIYLIYIKVKTENFTKILIPLILILLIIASTLMLMSIYTGENILEKFQTTASQNIFLPIFSNEISYGIISFYHLIDVLNELVLVFPLSLILLPVYKYLKTKELDVFYLTATIPFFIFILFVKANLGFSRDWDLFSLYSIPLFFLVVTLILRSGILKNKMIYPLIVVGLLHSFGFIVINSDEESSLKRAENLAQTSYWANQSKAMLYDEIAQFYKSQGKLEESEKSTNLAYQFEKNPRYLYRNAMIFLSQKNLQKTEYYLKELLKTDYAKGEVLNLLADLYFDADKFDSAMVYYEQNLKIEPNNFLAMNNIGIILMEQSKFNDAIKYFRNSLNVNHNDSYVYYYIAICYFNQKNYDKAMKYAKLSEKYGYKQSVINSFLMEINRRLGKK